MNVATPAAAKLTLFGIALGVAALLICPALAHAQVVVSPPYTMTLDVQGTDGFIIVRKEPTFCAVQRGDVSRIEGGYLMYLVEDGTCPVRASPFSEVRYLFGTVTTATQVLIVQLCRLAGPPLGGFECETIASFQLGARPVPVASRTGLGILAGLIALVGGASLSRRRLAVGNGFGPR